MNTNIKYLVDNGINIWNKDAYNYAKLKCNYNCNIEKFISDVKKSNKFHGYTFKLGNLGKIYGAQWRNWRSYNQGFDEAQRKNGNLIKGLDQISNLIKELKETPMSTKHIVTAWNPAELDEMALPPCHWSFEILVEPLDFNDRSNIANPTNGSIVKYPEFWDKLNVPKYQFTLKWHQRSVDTFLGQM